MSEQLVHVAATPLPAQQPSEMSELLRVAVETKIDPASIERLVNLKIQLEERNAEMAMAAALAAFQAECPPVPRTRTADVVKDGVKKYEYKFAPLDEVVRTIRPHLTKHGLSYTHDGAVSPKGEVAITCTLQHVMGARRTATFTGPTDQSGGKNALQAVGSARSYGRRYTLMDVLGLTTEDDDDGRGSHGDKKEPVYITEKEAADLGDQIEAVGADKAAFLRVLGVSKVGEVQAKNLRHAQQLLKQKEQQRARRGA
jgi:hypothetical protein